MNSNRLPPGRVVSLHDVRSDDKISDQDCERLSALQAAAWEAERLAHDERSAFERRMRMGAKWEAKNYRWDADLKMVRSVKGKAVGE